jgi:hypothetical protein
MSTTTLAEQAASTPTSLITTPEQFTSALQRWAGHYHVMAPFTNLTALAPQHGIIASQVLIDIDTRKEGANEVYDGLPFLDSSKGEVALAKRGLRKLAECAGISTTTERTDPRTLQFYWEIKARATYKGVDGSNVQREATVEWDLRDGSPRLKGWTAKQIEEARKHGLRACETRAINAVIRECGCGLKQKYTKEELRKPFLMLRISFQPDMSDPDVRRQVTEHHLAGTATLYPNARPALTGASSTDDVDDAPAPRLVGRSAAAPIATATTTTTTAADPNRPPTEDAVRIVDVKNVKQGTSAKGGAWTLWKVIDSNGVEHSTLDNDVATAAKAFQVSQAWVELTSETKGEYTNLVELQPAGTQPKLAGLAQEDL